jgi:SpoVK/Ycf46/Vps4 family AAA+-type ATPase
VLDTYINAGLRIDEGTPAALIVDDFDTTVGEWEHSTTTVNHQQVLAQLMHLADSPTEAAGKKLRRVPVIITGNDLSKVYPPLRRPGRMRSFLWIPSLDERCEIVAGILNDVLPSNEIPDLIRCVPNAPIAFFSDLLVELIASVSQNRVRDLATDLPMLVRPGNKQGEELRRQATNCRLSSVEIGELTTRVWEERQQATKSYLEK